MGYSVGFGLRSALGLSLSSSSLITSMLSYMATLSIDLKPALMSRPTACPHVLPSCCVLRSRVWGLALGLALGGGIRAGLMGDFEP